MAAIGSCCGACADGRADGALPAHVRLVDDRPAKEAAIFCRLLDHHAPQVCAVTAMRPGDAAAGTVVIRADFVLAALQTELMLALHP